jgi:hypothetical protein
MTIFQWTIPALWLVFIIYWGVSALGVKRNLGVTPWWRQSLLRVAIVVLIVAALHVTGAGHVLRPIQAYQAHSLLLGGVGAALVLVGLGFAIFARIWLGRNWGMPM